MEQYSALQQQHPLSPRKFWKKMIEKLAVWYVLGIIPTIIILLIQFTADESFDSNMSAILWWVLVVGFLFLVFISFIYAWYLKVYIRRYYYDASQDFITIKKGVFAPTEIHVQWSKIQDVYVDQDILDRIMGLYDVHIASATASSGMEAHIDGVEKSAAEGLKNILLDKVSSNNPRSGVQQSVSQDVSAQAIPQTTKINLNEEVSSNTYPLTGKWLAVTLFSRLLGSFVYPGFIILIIYGQLEEISIFDNWPYVVLAWLALGVLTMITRIITLFLWRSNYAFNFTEEHIYFREGIISISEKHMPYSSIQDVTVHQGILERIFGLAKVKIENASPQPIVVGRGQRVVFAGVLLQGLSLADANKITNLLKNTVLGKNSSHYGL